MEASHGSAIPCMARERRRHVSPRTCGRLDGRLDGRLHHGSNAMPRRQPTERWGARNGKSNREAQTSDLHGGVRSGHRVGVSRPVRRRVVPARLLPILAKNKRPGRGGGRNRHGAAPLGHDTRQFSRAHAMAPLVRPPRHAPDRPPAARGRSGTAWQPRPPRHSLSGTHERRACSRRGARAVLTLLLLASLARWPAVPDAARRERCVVREVGAPPPRPITDVGCC